jgi:hypothetical protein
MTLRHWLAACLFTWASPSLAQPCPNEMQLRAAHAHSIRDLGRALAGAGCTTQASEVWQTAIADALSEAERTQHQYEWGICVADVCQLGTCPEPFLKAGISALEAVEPKSSGAIRGNVQSKLVSLRAALALASKPPPSEPMRWPSITAGGAALLLGGLSVWTGLTAQGHYDDAARLGPLADMAAQAARCGGLDHGACQDQKDAYNSSGDDWRLATWALGGAAVVGAGIAVWLWFDPPLEGVSLSPVVNTRGGGAMIHVPF